MSSRATTSRRSTRQKTFSSPHKISAKQPEEQASERVKGARSARVLKRRGQEPEEKVPSKRPPRTVRQKRSQIQVRGASQQTLRTVKPKTATSSKAKAFKVCDVERNLKIGIAASNLQELRKKIPDHLPRTGDKFTLVLEEDCTRVEDEEYFETLPENTLLMVVQKGKIWTKAPSSLADEYATGLVELDGPGPSDQASHLAGVAARIARNPTAMVFLPKRDLEVVRDSDINKLQVLLCQSKEDAQFIQDACEKRLHELIRSEEAIDLLNLYESAKPKTEKVVRVPALTRSLKSHVFI